MAGLLDQYTHADNSQALKMVTWMAEYFYKRVQNVIAKYTIERHWRSLNEETGGMNDVLYRLYAITVGIKLLISFKLQFDISLCFYHIDYFACSYEDGWLCSFISFSLYENLRLCVSLLSETTQPFRILNQYSIPSILFAFCL